jgi:hypothetical protein
MESDKKPATIGPKSKYGVIAVAGGSLVGQAVELLQWFTGIVFPSDWPPLPPQAAILVATVLIVWPLAMVMPASDRTADPVEPTDEEPNP